MNYKNLIKYIGLSLVIIFSLIGLVFTGVFVAMKFGWTNVKGTISERNQALFPNIDPNKITANVADTTTPNTDVDAWKTSPEWAVMKEAFTRDQAKILKASADSGVPPRILLGGVIGEQFRFFSNSRESFKRYFEPLKILASLSSFSYGIAGLKPETVARIDENLQNPNSVFYLGKDMENVISYEPDADPSTVRFDRITNTKDPYYSYLYVGLFMRQVSAQWLHAGYNISARPGVLATLYNLGFNRSKPKADASVGGATIDVGGVYYSFGDLADRFYYSNELIIQFP